MTIKQQGGVFGRNPSFNTVETTVLDVDNLRLDGNTISSTNTNGDISLDPNGLGDLLLPSGNFGINAATPNNKLQINSGSSAAAPSAGDGGHGLAIGDAGFGLTAGALSSGNAYLQATRWDSIVANYNLVLQPNGGNVSVGSGNLVFASGNGIDFSATAGTGTSELFDDYEEGTWTPVISDGTNDATMNVSTAGSYTKIGNTVFFRARARVSALGSVSGAVRVTGLPFTIANDNSNYSGGSITGDGLNITAGQSLMYLTIIGANYLSLYLTDVTTGISALDAAELSATGDLYFSGQYYV